MAVAVNPIAEGPYVFVTQGTWTGRIARLTGADEAHTLYTAELLGGTSITLRPLEFKEVHNADLLAFAQHRTDGPR